MRLAIVLFLLLANSILAAGILDPDFGSGGKVNFRFSASSTDLGRAGAIQADGKIVIAGWSGLLGQSNGFRNFAVARLNANGTVDNTFGNGGWAITDFNNEEDVANAVVIQPDGKIVVGGARRTVQSTAFAFALARYNADGSLDTTFSGGKVVTDFEGSQNESVEQLLLQPDGKIIAVGSYVGSPSSQIAMARYKTDGTLDPDFGTGGKFTIFLPRQTFFSGAAVQPDGKIIVGGYYVFHYPGCVPTKGMGCDTDQSFLLRYTPQMKPDRKFGRKSGKEFSGLGAPDNFYGVSLQSDGRILVSTQRSPKRYSSNGRLETVFDRAMFASREFLVRRLSQRPDGKVAGCGALVTNGYDDLAVALFSSEGRLIGSDQRDFFGGDDVCFSILAQPDGKIIVIGGAQIAQQSAYSFAAVRYLDITP
ncbi:MAG: delta-60 repeat domain-containing protein [Acidobacteriota bacterium]|nr:delta-60 repeat domain-containing protein [Acidobacteriota bacterium]